MDNPQLLKQTTLFAIPFWYDKNHNYLTCKRYSDEKAIPKRYKDSVIRLTKELYISGTNEDRLLVKHTIIEYGENWHPMYIFPKEKAYKNLYPKCVPKFDSEQIFIGEACSNPHDVFNGNKYTPTLSILKVKGEFIVEDDDEIEYEEANKREHIPFSFSTDYDDDCLELSLCAMLYLSVWQGKYDPNVLKSALQLFSGDWPVDARIYATSEALKNMSDFIETFPFIPPKIISNMKKCLRFLVPLYKDSLRTIEEFYDTYVED